MKKILPFLFPMTSLAIVMFLAFRWYSNRTDRGNITPFAENVEIGELTDLETSQVLRGVGDFETVEMEGLGGETGEIRYELRDGKVRFSVTADVENEVGLVYQAWLKDPDSEAIRKAFNLEYLKGGMSGTASISMETLPFEVLISREGSQAELPGDTILKGLISEEESTEDCEEDCIIDLEELAK
jgi:hypothetical protein